MALVSTVDNASVGAKLEFREEHHVAVLIIHPLIVTKEDGTLIVWQDKFGDHNDNGQAGLPGNQFLKTNNIGILSCVLKHIPAIAE